MCLCAIKKLLSHTHGMNDLRHNRLFYMCVVLLFFSDRSAVCSKQTMLDDVTSTPPLPAPFEDILIPLLLQHCLILLYFL